MIIKRERSVVPACDVEPDRLEELIKATHDIDGIGAYKIGFSLGLSMGLPKVVEVVRKYTDKPIIYDHQKAATDIPETGQAFARTCKAAGVDAVIFFPQAGPETERAWIGYAVNEDLGVIVGGLMTHKKYVRSEGGYIADEAIIEMYTGAASLGVNDYVVPGNNPEAIKKIKAMLEREHAHPVLYSPGFIKQGGKVEDSARAAGGRFHAIVGRAIYGSADMRKSAEELCDALGRA
jgi:orotidine-5'-phosphate decarboxylase